MVCPLYLDTARLGLMTATAQRVHQDFVRHAGEEGCLLHFDDLLRSGYDAWPGSLRQAYPGLSSWQGVAALKASLRTLTQCRADQRLLLAHRSAQLMKLAARLLFHPCTNVLVTDLGWPPYHDLLERERCRAARRVTRVPVREAILREQASQAEIVTLLTAEFLRHHCDGLFLTAISNDGMRLPVEAIVRQIELSAEVRFVVVDGAQELCHGLANLAADCCDLYITGCHKWLRGYFPLGLGFYGKRRSRHLVETILHETVQSAELDDPLLRFTEQLERGSLDGLAETMNLAPLFSCQGAIADAPPTKGGLRDTFDVRLANAGAIAACASGTGWHVLRPQDPFRSGILLLQAQAADLRRLAPHALGNLFQEQGVALTAYEDGIIRLSMPPRRWLSVDEDRVRRSLQKVSGA